MNFTEVLMLGFALVTVVAGGLLAFSRDLVRALMLFFVVLLGTAALFVFAGADFAALAQIVLYVGGVLIAVLFGVMLTHKARGMIPRSEWNFLLPGIALASLLFIVLMSVVAEWHKKGVRLTTDFSNPTAGEIGMRFAGDYAAPFEAVSFLLLVAMVSAAFITRKEKTEGGKS